VICPDREHPAHAAPRELGRLLARLAERLRAHHLERKVLELAAPGHRIRPIRVHADIGSDVVDQRGARQQIARGLERTAGVRFDQRAQLQMTLPVRWVGGRHAN
jgi:hypothetical protein